MDRYQIDCSLHGHSRGSAICLRPKLTLASGATALGSVSSVSVLIFDSSSAGCFSNTYPLPNSSNFDLALLVGWLLTKPVAGAIAVQQFFQEPFVGESRQIVSG